jgi:hypothetical protein
MSITSSSMLVDLNISVWTANKVDKQATATVIEDNHAVRNAARVHKNLMAGTSLRKDIADFAASCYTWHRLRTVPWADRGSRLLPTSLFLDYKAEGNERRAKFVHMVDHFLREYPVIVSQAQGNLGAMHDPNDYPSVDEVAGKFGFRLVFAPVPESGDFRLDVPARELDELKEQYDQSFSNRMAEAMKEPWTRLHDMLQAMSAKLTDIDGVEEKKRYHETLVTNAQTMCGMLTHLNITKDAALERARQDLERAIFGVDIDDIKESPAIRADVKSKLDAMLKTYEW